jgi:hypothetical protein
MQMMKLFACVVACLGGLVAGNAAGAAEVMLMLAGQVTDVQDSPFAGGPTSGVMIGDYVDADVTYDDATAQSSGSFVSYELTDAIIIVPDTTQGGSFPLIPMAFNSATRVVFDGPDFQGLVLPNNVTGLDDVAAFDLTGLAFEAEGFNGPDFRFNLGSPVVEFFLPEPGRITLLGAGVTGLVALRARRKIALP